MARTLTMTFFILTLFSLPSQGQTDFRVMSYNVENLFDTKDDPLTADNDFLPSGNRHWTSGRFYHKLQQLAKVIYNPQNQKSRFQKRKIKKNGKRFVDSLYSLIDLKTI